MPAWLISRVARQLLAAAAMGAVLYLLQRQLGDVFTGSIIERALGLSVIVGTGAALYFGIAWLIGGIDRDDFRALFRRSPALSEEKE
jgi:putative peptidoglycan lipid II flippase